MCNAPHGIVRVMDFVQSTISNAGPARDWTNFEKRSIIGALSLLTPCTRHMSTIYTDLHVYTDNK